MWGIGASTGPIVAVEVAAAVSFVETDALAIVSIDTVDGRKTLNHGAQTSNPRGDDVAHACLRVLVDTGSQAVYAQVWGEITVIILFPKRVDV